MKNILYILLLATQALFAQTAFEKGNGQFRQGQYREAVASYESILKAKQESAEVYFNLGNAYFKLEQAAPAVFNYEKALQLDPGNRDIEINLGYAQQLITDNIAPVAQPGFAGMIDSLLGTWHHDTWGWIAVLSGFIALLLFAGYYLSRKTVLKRTFFTVMCLVLIWMVLSLVAAFSTKAEADNSRPAIVFSDMVQVKTEPSAGAQDAFIIHAGIKVYVLESREQWDKVQLPDETVGWIPSGAVRPLIP